MSQYGYVPPPSKRAFFFDSKKLQKKRDKEYKQTLEGQRQSSIQTQQNLMGRFGAQASQRATQPQRATGRINQHQSSVRSISQIKRPASKVSIPRIKRQNTSQQQKTIQTRRQGNAMTSINRKAPAGSGGSSSGGSSKAPRVSAKGKTATVSASHTVSKKAPDMRKTKTAPTVTKKTKIQPVKTAPQQSSSSGRSSKARVNPVQTAPSSRGVRPTEQTRPMAKAKVRVAEGTSAGLKKKKSY